VDDDGRLFGAGTDCDSTRAATGELRLIAAVLERAIDDARRGDPEAIGWLASNDEVAAEGLTLVAVCRYLDFDPGWIRSLTADYLAAYPYQRPLRHDPSGVAVAAA
jgi:hypothetical protein